jgi:TonB-linked SusC/RagA family outer membrane protein
MRKGFLLLFFAMLSGLVLLAQNRTIKGKVTDEKGNPIANASVVVKGSKSGTNTAQDGTFVINVQETAKTLVVSSLNFATQEISIGTKTELNISLQSTTDNLQEVIVVGYGTKKKADLTGSVATVKSTEIENRPFTSVDRALQGKVAGLQSVAASGQPGGDQSIRIRGVSSITASNSPLWVIDGVPVNTGDVSRLQTTANLLSTLNPNDVESISVLKDAASQSIYGSRAANGVILVTTKKGKSGKTKFRFDTEIGQSQVAFQNDRWRPLNASEYLTIAKEGLENAGRTPAQVTSTLTSLGLGNGIDFNWLDHAQVKGTQQQYNISAEGGNDKTSFFISGGRFVQEGTVINSKFTRTNGNIRITNKATDKLTLGVNLNGGAVSQKAPLAGGAFGNPVLSSYFLLPTRSAFNPDGSYNLSVGGLHNTLALAEIDKRFLREMSMRGSLTADYKILDNLKFRSAYGVDYNVLEEDQYNNPLHGDGLASNGRAFAFYTRYFNWVWTNTLDYNANILKNGDLTTNLQIGYESQKSQGYLNSLQSQQFPPTLALTFPISGASPTTATATITEYTFASQFASASINYKNRFVVSGSFRRDGSSRFSAANRYGNFWSIGGTWNIEKESFMENVRFINQLKLRSSYGVNGNAGIGNYDALPLYGYGFNYNQQPGSAPGNVGDPNLTWELNKPFNIGLDASFFNSRLNITAEYYNRKSEDLLLDVPLSRTSGFATATRNIGSMENKGIELTISGTPLKTKNFTWDIDFNFANNKNLITSLPNGSDIPDGNFIIRQGASFRTYFLRVYAGVDPANGDPLWYTDADRKTTTNAYPPASTRQMVGQALPKVFGSLTNTFTYKNFTLNAQLFYNFGNHVYNTWGSYQLASGFGPTFNKVVRIFDRWQKPGDKTDIPRYIENGNKNFQSSSTMWYNDGGFIRLRDVQVGYNLPKSLIGKMGLTNVNFYVRGTNIWTWVKDKEIPYDPEQGVNAGTNLNVFIPKTVTVGLNVAF